MALWVVGSIFGGLFLVFFGFLALAYGVVKGETPRLSGGPRVGVVEVKGAIGGGPGGVDSERVMKQLRRFAEDSSIKAILVRIDSPGGAVAPSQEIYEEVRKVDKKKPVVCSLGNIAASGGFYVAVGCRKIVAEPGTLTGSIGVISQFVNAKGLVARFDLKFETIKSGKLKDMGSPFREMAPEERAYWQETTNRIYEQFLGAVAEGRNLPADEIREVADGRVITGEDAKELGLVDELGNFYTAVDLAMKEAGATGEASLVYPPEEGARFFEQLVSGGARAAAQAIRAELQAEASEARQPGLYFLSR
jgi:protease-4